MLERWKCVCGFPENFLPTCSGCGRPPVGKVCACCGKTYEEHLSGLAFLDFTGAGAECNGYVEVEPMCRRCGVASFACECGEEEAL